MVNAHRINKGEMPLLNVKGKDFFFETCTEEYEAARNVVALCERRLPAHFKADPLRDIQVLCPQKRGECGVNRLNALLRRRLIRRLRLKMNVFQVSMFSARETK